MEERGGRKDGEARESRKEKKDGKEQKGGEETNLRKERKDIKRKRGKRGN